VGGVADLVNTNRTALVTGALGQDGYYLCRFLARRGYRVVGVVKPSRLGSADAESLGCEWLGVDLRDGSALRSAIREVRPAEIYHLAACHFPSDDRRNRLVEEDAFRAIHVDATQALLEVIRGELSDTKFFFASTCHVFGDPAEIPQNEATPRAPKSHYARTKQEASELCEEFTAVFGVHATVGILYNHESPRRQDHFVTGSIVKAAAEAARGDGKPLVLKDPLAVVDWGAARDYVEAMWLANHCEAGEYVVATGCGRTVFEFAEAAYGAVGLQARDWIREDDDKLVQGWPYIGDASKLSNATGWGPRTQFVDMVREMVESRLS
jgi:GDPmannose 4,6-dehydratase